MLVTLWDVVEKGVDHPDVQAISEHARPVMQLGMVCT